ncbi:hypothetical protein C8Q77DRAFT_1126536 [Trametes polyzona]|nr:hypothetical protein C8Q77DRAFT_1126536 [Trametes polyzona]
MSSIANRACYTFPLELYCYLRSPYRDLAAYDRNVQYDIPPGVPAPDASSRGQRRWHSPSHSRSRSRSRSRIRSRSSPRSPPHSRARSPGSAVYDPQDRGDHATSSQHTSRRQAGDIRRVSNGRRPSQYASADGQHSRHRSITRQSRNDRHSRSEVPHSRTNQLSAPTYSHRHRGRYDGKGKGRADDNADDSDCSSRSFTLREGSGVTSGGSEHDGISRNMENSPLSRGGGQNDIGPSALSTPPRSAGLTAAITQNAGPSSLISRVAPPIKDVDKATTPDHGSPAGGDNAQASTLQKPAMEPRQPPRARRNPWQTMQEYLSKGASGPRSSAHGDKASAAELASTPRSQVQQEAAYSPRGGALRPEDPPSSGEAVPSLLLRLSDPAPPPSASDPRLVSSGVPDAARAPLPVHEGGKGGKGISAPEIMARTRARLARMADAADQSSTTPPPPPSSDSIVQQSPGSGVARESSTTNNVAGVGDVGAVEHMSSEDGGQGKGATGPARSGAHAPALATSADPRSLLMQKLAAEKRDAADIPTAEKAQLSSRAAPRPSVPMVLPHAGSSSTRTGGGGAVPQPHSKSAPGDDVVVPAERIAERREAELRSQAQLRVRLAAAKRAAAAAAAAADPTAGSANRLAHNSQHHPDSGASGGGTGDSTATIDGDLAVHESALRERLRLKGRQAQM